VPTPSAQQQFATHIITSGSCEDEGDRAAATRPLAFGSLDRLAAEEGDVGLQLRGEQQPGLDRVVVGRQLGRRRRGSPSSRRALMA